MKFLLATFLAVAFGQDTTGVVLGNDDKVTGEGDCSTVRCPEGSVCVQSDVVCLASPCPLLVECVPKVCPAIACAPCDVSTGTLSDITGFSADGCPTCDCCPLLACPAVECLGGVKRDDSGCPTCECAEYCPPVLCATDECIYGHQPDPRTGCQTCTCNPKPDCPAVMCDMYCENGFALSDDGCPVCKCDVSRCVPGSKKRDDCNECSCDETYNWACTEMACEPETKPPLPEPSPETCKVEFESAFGWFAKPADESLYAVADSPRVGVCTEEVAQLISTGSWDTNKAHLIDAVQRIDCSEECLNFVKRAASACQAITLSYEGMTGTFKAEEIIDAAKTVCGIKDDDTITSAAHVTGAGLALFAALLL